jgi:hypothetical protein
MAKDTIENRVYLFESLASSFISSIGDQLVSGDEAVRERARQALADLAFVSCAVADTGHLSPEQVRERMLGAPEPDSGKEEEAEDGRDKSNKGKKRK